MLVLTGQEMAALDATAQADYGLSGLVLMENAGREVAAAVRARYGPVARVGILCGPGNNGGDGFVAGRHLFLQGQQVVFWLAVDEEDYRGDALANLKIARALDLKIERAPRGEREQAALLASLQRCAVIVDALFGTGFRGVPRPEAAALIRLVNASGRPVVAVDIPSGVEADTGAVHGEAIRAAITVTFALPKLGCLLYPGAGHCGALSVVPISLPVGPAAEIRRHLTEPAEVLAWLPHRPRDAHKGRNGHVVVIGGSPGLAGAPFLTALGALRIGAGLATVLLPAGLPPVDKPAEVMTGALPAAGDGGFAPEAAAAVSPYLAGADVVAVGPGLGRSHGAWELLAAVIAAWEGPLVLDADALNLLAVHREAAAAVHGPWVLTPHPGEMARLTGLSIAEVQADRVGLAKRQADAWQATVVLKGVPTVTAWPTGRVWLNPTGDPAMATGGMGDVLTGIIAGLIGQGVPPDEAAVAGAYLHGLAGETAAAARGGPGILAGEVAAALPMAVRKVKDDCRAIQE